MDSDPIVALFKLGDKARMAQLLHEGHVFMNTVSYFAKLEKGSPRSDPDEGTGYCQQADGAKLQVQRDGSWEEIGTLGEIRIRDEDLSSVNLYCLHARKRSHYGHVLRLAELGFGDSYVLFTDTDEFFWRLAEAVARAGHELRSGLVEYVDRRTYSGPMGTFRKFSERVGDIEFRIAVLPGTGAPLSLRLGDLSDIAIMGSTSDRLRLEPK